MKKLFAQGLLRFAAGVVLLGTLLFGSAGTLRWRESWLFMGILFIPMFLAGLVMLRYNPELLRRRLNVREEQSEQRAVIAMSGALFIVVFVLAGLDHRFGWSNLPRGVSIGAAAVFLLSYLLYAEVLRENRYLSRTVEVQEGQQVIDSGLYGIVRHPMYSATTVLFLSMPLVLGSLPSFAAMLLYVPIIVRRIRNEETVLSEGLAGYKDYVNRVKYRLIPYIW